MDETKDWVGQRMCCQESGRVTAHGALWAFDMRTGNILAKEQFPIPHQSGMLANKRISEVPNRNSRDTSNTVRPRGPQGFLDKADSSEIETALNCASGPRHFSIRPRRERN